MMSLPDSRASLSDVIVGDTQAGYSPQEIADDMLPHLTPAQIYDALSYYEDHRPQIEAILQANTPEAWQARLGQQLGQETSARLMSR